MSLDVFTAVAPNRQNETTNPTGNDLALVIEEFSGMVEGTIQRKSVLAGWVPLRGLKGTATLTNYSVGETTLTKIERGKTPDGSHADFSKIGVTIDTPIMARNTLMVLDEFQTVFDARQELSQEHGKKIGKFLDQALFIQAIKSGLLTASPYGSAGHQGGTQIVTADPTDPAILYADIARLFAGMEDKDVVPGTDDVVLALKPASFYTLLQAEQIVNGEYVTANGTKVENGFVFKAFGCPVIRSNNLPAGQNITAHPLSNTRNSNAFNGDFTKIVACAFSPRALLAGSNIPLQHKVFFDDVSKHWYVDSWLAFSATPNRPEFAGVIRTA